MNATGHHYGKNVVEDLRIFGKLLLLKGLLSLWLGYEMYSVRRVEQVEWE